MFGQDIVKLTVMDLVMTIGTTVITDYIRAVFIRYLNNYWCWDMEVRWVSERLPIICTLILQK